MVATLQLVLEGGIRLIGACDAEWRLDVSACRDSTVAAYLREGQTDTPVKKRHGSGIE